MSSPRLRSWGVSQKCEWVPYMGRSVIGDQRVTVTTAFVLGIVYLSTPVPEQTLYP